MRQKLNMETLLDTCLPLFQEKGFENVSVNEICAAVGVTKPTFYKYVPSKDDLLLLFYRNCDKDLMPRLTALESAKDYLGEVWMMFTLTIYRTEELGPELYSHYLVHCFRDKEVINKTAFRLKPLIEQSITKAQEAGQITNKSNPALLFRTLLDSTIGLYCQWCFGTREFDLVPRFKQQFDLILRPAK